jgi:elongation factor P
MAELQYDEIKERKYIVLDGEPWEVLTSHVFRKQQRKPVNATKLRNLKTGKVTEQSFHVSEKVEEAEIENREVKYLYQNRGEFWFCDPSDPSDRFEIDGDLVGTQIRFIKPNSIITAMTFDEEIIGLKYPIKVDLKVTEAHEAVRGNTAQGATKQVKVETGAEVYVPMFIKEGEMIRINTETGEYAERAGGGF